MIEPFSANEHARPRRELRLAALALLIATAVACTLVGSCATTGVNRGDFNLISIEEEWELGEKLAGDLEKQLPLVDDRRALAMIDRVGQRIVAQTELAQLPWRFHLVADPEVNAFAIPGGHVYVNAGLIVEAPNAAGFAGVMAHEIGHGVARHATEQITQAYGFSILAGLVLGREPEAYEEILADIVAGGAFASFSRDAEREADRLGVRYMHAAGYDPLGMAEMFEVLLAERERRPNSVERFFATHPLTEERIREVRREAVNLPRTEGLIVEDPDFRRLQDRVRRHAG